MREVGDEISRLDGSLKEIDNQIRDIVIWIPNLPHESVPVGADESFNEVAREWGSIEKKDFKVLTHWEIGEKLGILDLEAATKISGSGFYLLKGLGAKLQRALVSYMLDTHSNDGFTEIAAPFIVTADTMFGTGQLPKLENDMYKTTEDGMYLIPTAEVSITNCYKQQIVGHDELPIKMVGHSPCFRREAGAAGKDTRGMIRVHQFDKVEMVKIVEPEKSYDELETLVAQAEKIALDLQEAGIPAEPTKEIIALIAYLQRLGTDIKVNNLK
jgi:seryl-tRNA synthetase